MQQTAKLYVYDTTVATPFALLMFGGEVQVEHEDGLVTVDGWIRFRAVARIGVLVKALRKHLDSLLRTKIERPDLDLATKDHPVIEAIFRLLTSAGF